MSQLGHLLLKWAICLADYAVPAAHITSHNIYYVKLDIIHVLHLLRVGLPLP